jgi:CoA-transferase family III
MALTGRPAGPPLGAPVALIDLIERAVGVFERQREGGPRLDGLALLGERAAVAGLSRGGTVSCGGGTRLVPARDGWLAVSLGRPEDVAALPAWLGRDVASDEPWPIVQEVVASMSTAALDAQAALLSLPFAAVGSVGPRAQCAFDLPVCARAVGTDSTASRPLGEITVVDLSSLWAGPLCGQLLAEAGARVIKVESTGRPDGARRGPTRFFDVLNGTKRSVALDLASAAGRRDLERLLSTADVVIESARPRALEQMGIDAGQFLDRTGGPLAWVSITSHGHGPGDRQRVGFGDVAAAAGGLVAPDGEGPCFLADAVADPVSGLVAAAAVLEALAAGGRWHIDAAMAPMAAAVAGPLLDVAGLVAQPPRARPPVASAPELGADTAAVLGALVS